jgi:hypothetical protein
MLAPGLFLAIASTGSLFPPQEVEPPGAGGPDDAARVEEAVETLDSAGRGLRSELARVTEDLPGLEGASLESAWVTSLTPDLSVLGFPASEASEGGAGGTLPAARRSDEVVGHVLLARGDTPPAHGLPEGLYQVKVSGVSVQLLGPTGAVAATVDLLAERALTTGGGTASTSPRATWSLAYLSVVHHLARTAAL